MSSTDTPESKSPETVADREMTPDEGSMLQGILDASTEYSIVATALDGTIELWNRGARRIYGYSPEEILGRNVRLLHPPDEVARGRVDAMFESALEEGYWDGILHRIRKNGVRFLARVALTVRRGSDGSPVGFLSISSDLSEESRLEQRLRESEEYNRKLVEATMDGLLITDLEGEVTDANREMERLSGRPRSGLLGHRLVDFIDPSPALSRALAQLAQGRPVRDLELTLRRPDGGRIELSCNASALFGGRDRPSGLIAAVRDVSDAKRLREQLEAQNRELQVQNDEVQEASRLKSEFLATMSHELRTPLNSIIGFSDFLLTDPDGRLAPDQREYLSDILSSGNHLLSLINDVLDLAKIESGKLELRPGPCVLSAAIEEVCSVLRPQFQARQLTLSVRVDPSVDRIIVDEVRLKQILFNLLSNAVKFTGPVGEVEVTAAPYYGRMVEVRVRDTGIGIPVQDLSRIFREFEQLDTGAGRHYSGTGLGLSVCRKLVDLMGGGFTVQSQVGVGSVFAVQLPFVPGPPLPDPGGPR